MVQWLVHIRLNFFFFLVSKNWVFAEAEFSFPSETHDEEEEEEGRGERTAGVVGGKMGEGDCGRGWQPSGRETDGSKEKTWDIYHWLHQQVWAPPGMLHCSAVLLQYWLIPLLTVRRSCIDCSCLTASLLPVAYFLCLCVLLTLFVCVCAHVR